MNKDQTTVEVTRHDLKALVFWAASGVQMYNTGGYKNIENVLNQYRRHLGMMTKSTRPYWGIRRQEFDLNQFKEATDKCVSLAYEEAAKVAETFENGGMIAAAIRALDKPTPKD